MEAEAAEDTLLLPRLKAPRIIGARFRGGGTCADKVKRARELALRRQHQTIRVSRGGCSPGLQTPAAGAHSFEAVSDTATTKKKLFAIKFLRIVQAKLVPRHHVISQNW